MSRTGSSPGRREIFYAMHSPLCLLQKTPRCAIGMTAFIEFDQY